MIICDDIKKSVAVTTARMQLTAGDQQQPIPAILVNVTADGLKLSLEQYFKFDEICRKWYLEEFPQHGTITPTATKFSWMVQQSLWNRVADGTVLGEDFPKELKDRSIELLNNHMPAFVEQIVPQNDGELSADVQVAPYASYEVFRCNPDTNAIIKLLCTLCKQDIFNVRDMDSPYVPIMNAMLRYFYCNISTAVVFRAEQDVKDFLEAISASDILSKEHVSMLVDEMEVKVFTAHASDLGVTK